MDQVVIVFIIAIVLLVIGVSLWYFWPKKSESVPGPAPALVPFSPGPSPAPSPGPAPALVPFSPGPSPAPALVPFSPGPAGSPIYIVTQINPNKKLFSFEVQRYNEFGDYRILARFENFQELFMTDDAISFLLKPNIIFSTTVHDIGSDGAMFIASTNTEGNRSVKIDFDTTYTIEIKIKRKDTVIYSESSDPVIIPKQFIQTPPPQPPPQPSITGVPILSVEPGVGLDIIIKPDPTQIQPNDVISYEFYKQSSPDVIYMSGSFSSTVDKGIFAYKEGEAQMQTLIIKINVSRNGSVYFTKTYGPITIAN